MEVNPQKLSVGKIIGWAVLIVVVIGAFWLVATRNTLVKMRENIKTQLSQVEVQYQRRFDLIPNVIASTQAVLSQEQALTQMITEARTRYSGVPSGSNEKVQAINQLESGIGRLLVVIENYPELRSSETVSQLIDQLEGTENRIAVERSRYNESVNVYNQKIQFFPSNLVASMFNFEPYERFVATTEAQTTVPKVDLKVGPQE